MTSANLRRTNGVDMGVVISAIVGGALALAAVFGLVNTAGSTPDPVTAPYVVYGSTS